VPVLLTTLSLLQQSQTVPYDLPQSPVECSLQISRAVIVIDHGEHFPFSLSCVDRVETAKQAHVSTVCFVQPLKLDVKVCIPFHAPGRYIPAFIISVRTLAAFRDSLLNVRSE
jgi:hypothetical protein